MSKYNNLLRHRHSTFLLTVFPRDFFLSLSLNNTLPRRHSKSYNIYNTLPYVIKLLPMGYGEGKICNNNK